MLRVAMLVKVPSSLVVRPGGALISVSGPSNMGCQRIDVDGGRSAGPVTGEEYPFYVFSKAYREWQRGVKSPVAPEPTLIGSLGEVLTNAGFGSRRTEKDRLRVLPDPGEMSGQTL